MNLEVDHYFFTVSVVEFEKIVENKSIYELFRDVSTDTSEARYRGLYLTFDNGTYLEILYPHKDFEDGTFGVSLADLDRNQLDQALFPDSEYIQKKDIFSDDEYWYSLYESSNTKNTRVYVFGMQYSDGDLKKRLNFQKQKTFELVEINVRSAISPDMVRSEIEKFSKGLGLDKITFAESSDEVVNLVFKLDDEIFRVSFKLK